MRARNQDLTEAQADDLADRFSHDLVEDLVTAGVITFDRDRRQRRRKTV